MPSWRPRAPSCSARLALTLTRSTARPSVSASRVPHRVEPAREPRGLRHDRRVHVHDAPAVASHPVHHLAQEAEARDPAVPGIRVREVLAQVPEGERAEEGVRHRVGQHVGVGVAPEPPLGRDLDPPQHERPALDEGVDVEPQADPRHRDRPRRRGATRVRPAGLARSRRASGRSSGRVIFTLPGSPGTRRTGGAQPLDQRGVVRAEDPVRGRPAVGLPEERRPGTPEGSGSPRARRAARSPSPSPRRPASASPRPGGPRSRPRGSAWPRRPGARARA